MRVFEESVPATCAIMSEEKGLNGTASEGCSKVHLVKRDHSPTTEINDALPYGGRLKFFKDGKFILELSHRKDGEKMSWTPVPKKTYWPPSVTTTATTNNLRQESTASLSVSDDNSSVQSSPWQRDHCWKQNSPRKAANIEMTFVMLPLPRALHARKQNCSLLHKKRRRPYDVIESVIDVKCLNSVNGVQRPVKTRCSAMKSGGLNKLIHRLWESVQSTQKQQASSTNNSSCSSSMFSPRKRILRELEKVCLSGGLSDEQLQQKRQRSKVTAVVTSPPRTSVSKGVSSYSIVSLLGKEEGNNGSEQEPSFLRNLLRSPKREMSPEPCPKTRKNSPSHLSPSPESVRPSTSSTLHGPPQLPLIHSPMMYSPFYSHQPPGFSSPPFYSNTSSYRGSSHALWVQYPMSSLPQSGSYPGFMPSLNTPQFSYHWGSPHTSTALEVKKDDSDTDVPLNLSKHPG